MDKIVKAKLHSGAFCAGVNLGTDLVGTGDGAKVVDMKMEGPFLKITKGTKSILIPFTNVQQIELETVETTTKK